jgi:hypothetical protein
MSPKINARRVQYLLVLQIFLSNVQGLSAFKIPPNAIGSARSSFNSQAFRSVQSGLTGISPLRRSSPPPSMASSDALGRALRDEFPILKQTVHDGKPLVYLDRSPLAPLPAYSHPPLSSRSETSARRAPPTTAAPPPPFQRCDKPEAHRGDGGPRPLLPP